MLPQFCIVRHLQVPTTLAWMLDSFNTELEGLVLKTAIVVN